MICKIGDAVISTAGHDAGLCFVVVAIDGEFAMIANGKQRMIEMPKKKKSKHLEIVGNIGEELSNELKNGCGVFSKASGTGNAWLRKSLKTLGYNNSKIMIER